MSRSERRKLHPLYLIFALAGTAKSLLIPGLIAVFFASRSDRWESWAMVLVFFPAALAVVGRYATFRYRLDDEGIVVSGGVFTRFERHIPYDRIQNIALEQNLMHRLLRIGSVKLETASGEEAEATMEALSLDAIEELRRRHAGRPESRSEHPGEDGVEGTPPGIAVEESETLLELPLREIILAGLISNRGLAVVAAAFGLLWNLDFALEDYIGDLAERIEEERPDASRMTPGVLVITSLVGFVAFVIFMKLLSVVWMLAELHGFRLRRSGDGLEMESGLFTRTRATLPIRRIQHVTWRRSPLHRLFRRAQGVVATAGESSADNSLPRKTRLAPILAHEEEDALMRRILPECDASTVEWRAVRPRAWRRLFMPRVLFGTLVAGIASIWFGPMTAVPWALWVGYAFVHSKRSIAVFRWAITDEVLASISGWPTHRTRIVRRRKIQSVAIDRSPFDRRLGMATVSVDTAGGSFVSGIQELLFLDDDTAIELAEELRVDVARSAFEW